MGHLCTLHQRNGNVGLLHIFRLQMSLYAPCIYEYLHHHKLEKDTIQIINVNLLV